MPDLGEAHQFLRPTFRFINTISHSTQ